MPNSKFIGKIREGLVNMAVEFVEKDLYRNIDEKGLPEAIKRATSIGTVQGDEGRLYIEVKIDLKEAPMARAFEYGSGIHSKKDAKTYRIPKEGGAKYVAFPKERWKNYAPPPDAPDVFVFTHVNHPGVVAKPYIAPSIASIKGKAIRLLARFAKAGLAPDVKITYIKA